MASAAGVGVVRGASGEVPGAPGQAGCRAVVSGVPLSSSRSAVLAVTAAVMGAFAANSVIARLALRETAIDAATFTGVRLVAGAVVLAAVVRLRGGRIGGSWASAAALFVYAAGFSAAYLALSAGTGALLLFGAVQLTMIGWGRIQGDRLTGAQTAGVVLALGGLVALVAPGVAAPPAGAALAMAAAGFAWGLYSLRGRGTDDPAAATAGNFVRAVPFALVLAWMHVARGRPMVPDPGGLAWAALSGAVTSGLGYLAWYAVLPSLRAASAATVQLSVPVLAALGGVAVLGEPITARLALASAVTLGGIALVVRQRPPGPRPRRIARPSCGPRGSTARARSAPAR